MLETIIIDDTLYALVIRKEFTNENSQFFTEDKLQFQVGYIRYKKGETIQPHLHNKQERIVYLTPEFILLKKGKVRVNFFSDKKVLLGNTILNQFDSILLYEGAHSFDILEDMELIEVKQGPYIEENDKIKW
jgi:hypothetical protein